MTHPAIVADIARQAAILAGKAEAAGVTLRITGKPLMPLAMGNTEHVVEAWPARKGPVVYTGGSMPMKPISDREWAAQPANLREGCTTHVPGVGDL